MNGVGAGIQAGEMVAIGVLALSFHMWRIFWVSFRTLQDVFHHSLFAWMCLGIAATECIISPFHLTAKPTPY